MRAFSDLTKNLTNSTHDSINGTHVIAEQSQEPSLPAGVTICDGSAPVGDVAALILQNPIPYCMNYGTCQSDYKTNPEQPCNCPHGFEGVHCEFASGTAPATCSLECFSGGVCQLGAKSFELVINEWVPRDQMQYCLCPPNTQGQYCEQEVQKCGTGHCLNGGQCVMVNNSQYCDCSTAVTATSLYAGKFCENPASVICSAKNEANGHHFCVNGGTCISGGALGCNCPDGFMGPICEFPATKYEYSPCTLQCQNGGICRKGPKDVSFLAKFGLHRGLLGQLYDTNYESCVCPYGYVGLTCQYEMDVCPGENWVCMHGGQCEIAVDNVTGDASSLCDCSKAETFDSRFTGSYCNIKSTEFCTANGAKTADGVGYNNFCTNGGNCTSTPVNQASGQTGCICPEGYYGEQCQLGDGISLTESASNKGILVGLSVGLTILAFFLFAIAYYRIKSRLFRNSFRPKRGLTTSCYKDSPPTSATKTLGPWIKSKTDSSQTKNLQGFRPDLMIVTL